MAAPATDTANCVWEGEGTRGRPNLALRSRARAAPAVLPSCTMPTRGSGAAEGGTCAAVVEVAVTPALAADSRGAAVCRHRRGARARGLADSVVGMAVAVVAAEAAAVRRQQRQAMWVSSGPGAHRCAKFQTQCMRVTEQPGTPPRVQVQNTAAAPYELTDSKEFERETAHFSFDG